MRPTSSLDWRLGWSRQSCPVVVIGARDSRELLDLRRRGIGRACTVWPWRRCRCCRWPVSWWRSMHSARSQTTQAALRKWRISAKRCGTSPIHWMRSGTRRRRSPRAMRSDRPVSRRWCCLPNMRVRWQRELEPVRSISPILLSLVGLFSRGDVAVYLWGPLYESGGRGSRSCRGRSAAGNSGRSKASWREPASRNTEPAWTL